MEIKGLNCVIIMSTKHKHKETFSMTSITETKLESNIKINFNGGALSSDAVLDLDSKLLETYGVHFFCYLTGYQH